MSLAILKSRALAGVNAPEVTVEVHLANGLPAFTIVGLAETEVKEARERVRAAIQNARFEFPAKRITVNLAPADLPKESGRFDLPIALGILAASGQIPEKDLHRYEFAGELSLSGELRPIRGALAMTVAMQQLSTAKNQQAAFILPAGNAREAALAGGITILPAASLLEVCAHFSDTPAARLKPCHDTSPVFLPSYPDFAEVKGQAQAKRALEIAAAGGHNVLMSGPPGAGKTMLAVRLPGILPPMTDEEALASAAIQSLTGRFDPARWKTRPFRSPHHTASGVALVGGGSTPRPGEISLAHGGILFLDELPEFDRRVLEVLREPLESGVITISRAARQATFPARFQLIAAMNPCPCGYFGHHASRCRCTPDTVRRYQARLSGPLMDRIDIQIVIPALDEAELMQPAAGEPSAKIAARVARARLLQHNRQGKPNCLLSPAEIDAFCKPDEKGENWLKQAMSRLDLSARAYHRILRVARTIADIGEAPRIEQPHIAEAIQYRRILHTP